MLVAVIVLAVLAVGALIVLMMTRQKAAELSADLDATDRELDEVTAELERAGQRLGAAEGRIADLDAARLELTGQNDALATRLDDTNLALHKRTDLADAQAMQIDALSAERDDLRQQLTAAEEQVITLAARPGVVVGELTADEASAEMLWDLELARSERAWRNSVAINPVDDQSPFESTADPVRTAVEIEASALREDVGALIDIDWQAPLIESPARRLLVVRVAQEMLASASRVPGAARLVVTPSGSGDGELKLEFESADDTNSVINLIPPQISGDLVDVRNDANLSVTVKAGDPVL